MNVTKTLVKMFNEVKTYELSLGQSVLSEELYFEAERCVNEISKNNIQRSRTDRNKRKD